MSEVVPQRQSVSYLTRRFREVGLEPATRHGQNFLIDLNLQQFLVDAADLTKDDVVFEVGTGTGALTGLIAQRAGRIVTVEIDQRLYQIASEELIDFDNVTMLDEDVLHNKNNFKASVLNEIDSTLAEQERSVFKLVANLPYNIATPVISNLLLTDHVPRSMTVTIQKELAERIVAKPSTKDYGSLSVWIQSQCEAEILKIMSPKVFWPKPKVESAIIQIRLVDELRERIPDIAFFHQFCRTVFFHRRKFLRSVLVAGYKRTLSKPDIDEIMAERGLGANARTEQLEVEELMALGESIRIRLREAS